MAPQRQFLPTGAQLDNSEVEAFGARLHGDLVRPADAGYEAARRVWNGMIDRYPTLIARCDDVHDVRGAVDFAREHDLPIAIRGGGHNVAGNAVCDGGLVVDLSKMRRVEVDPEARVARVQGGATWADVDAVTQAHGLATPGGAVSPTGVAGLTLHGGFGHLRRKYGLSLDNLLAVEIVTADGQVRQASTTENADLFWAVRGAGSNFGVVTSFEFQLHPVGPTLMLCAPVYPLDDAGEVLSKWQSFMQTAPDEVSSATLLWSLPADPNFPEELHGAPIVLIAAVYCGDPDEGERLMEPLRDLATPLLDLSGPQSYVALQSGFDPLSPAGLRYYWKSLYIDELNASLIEELERWTAERPSARTAVEIWHHGGAIARVPAEATAFGRRSWPFMVNLAAVWVKAEDSDANIAWARDAWSAIQRFSSAGGAYLNFPGFGEEKEALVRAAYGPNYERLVALKTQYDPRNLFRFNQNIRPSS